MKDLKILVNELIPVYQDDNKQLVNGRKLHSFLEVATKFSDWMKDKI